MLLLLTMSTGKEIIGASEIKKSLFVTNRLLSAEKKTY
ncbi:hypothetical protein X965_12340 [Morganella sp. EGD-HP17]|nr:hypothetical protein X965_12340 [Morganella sp. EGD-HP17]